MKNFLFVFSFLLMLSSCGNEPAENEMRLTGEVKGLRKGNLWLQKLDDSILVNLDSMVVDGNANFEFSDVLSEPEVYYLTMSFQDSSNIIKRVPFFAESGEITLTTSLEDYELDLVVTGSENQRVWDDYKKLMKRYNDQNLQLIEDELNAMKEGNDSLVAQVKQEKDRLLKNTYLASVNFAKNHGDYEVAPYIVLTEVFDLNTRFLDTIQASLSPKIKDSKYGKELESLIQSRTE